MSSYKKRLHQKKIAITMALAESLIDIVQARAKDSENRLIFPANQIAAIAACKCKVKIIIQTDTKLFCKDKPKLDRRRLRKRRRKEKCFVINPPSAGFFMPDIKVLLNE